MSKNKLFKECKTLKIVNTLKEDIAKHYKCKNQKIYDEMKIKYDIFIAESGTIKNFDTKIELYQEIINLSRKIFRLKVSMYLLGLKRFDIVNYFLEMYREDNAWLFNIADTLV